MSERLVLIPGLGADARMFEGQRGAFPGSRVLGWIPHVEGESLGAYAQRLWRMVVPRKQGLVLAGASMGGMIALEIARRADRGEVTGVVLIGSCRSPEAIAPPLRRLEAAMRRVPPGLLGIMRPMSGAIIRSLGPWDNRTRDLLAAMIDAADLRFVRWGAGAIMGWPGVPEPGVPVWHVHGRRDRVIRWRHAGASHVIAGAGHVPGMTHPDEVNRVIRLALDQESPP